MENFDIILVLARIALDADAPRAAQQIDRLKGVLESSDGEARAIADKSRTEARDVSARHE